MNTKTLHIDQRFKTYRKKNLKLMCFEAAMVSLYWAFPFIINCLGNLKNYRFWLIIHDAFVLLFPNELPLIPSGYTWSIKKVMTPYSRKKKQLLKMLQKTLKILQNRSLRLWPRHTYADKFSSLESILVVLFWNDPKAVDAALILAVVP